MQAKISTRVLVRTLKSARDKKFLMGRNKFAMVALIPLV
jgi:hypothetical protein